MKRNTELGDVFEYMYAVRLFTPKRSLSDCGRREAFFLVSKATILVL